MKRFVLVALALAACACATVPSPDPVPAPPGARRATLAVVVTDAANGAAIAGATVTLHTGETATTNADGYVEWPDLDLGARGITVSALPHYRERFYALEAFAGNIQVPLALDAIVVVPPAPPITAPWTGQLRKARDDLGFQDAEGRWVLPLCAHYGEAFSAFVHGKTIGTVGSSSALRGFGIEEQLRRIKAAGYDCIRSWSILGYYDQNRPDQRTPWKAWAGKEVTPYPFTAFSGRSIPETPNYYEQHAAFVAAVKAAGLTLFESRGDMVGQPASKIRAHTERATASYERAGWDVLALAEACNECFQNGSFTPAELLEIVAPYKAHGALTIHSTADPAEEPDAIATISAGAPLYTVHGLRVGTPTQLLEHIFSLGYFTPRATAAGMVPRLGIQGEPAGPGDGVSVGRVNDREMLAMMAATSLISRQWWVYMSGFGVFWDGPIESQPGFYVVPRMRKAIVDFAPDVMSWGLYHGGRIEAALRSPTGYAGDPGNIAGPARIFNAVRPDRRRFVAVVEGGNGLKQIQNALYCPVTIDVIGVGDDEQLTRATFTLQPRDSMAVDYRYGRLVLGACQ